MKELLVWIRNNQEHLKNGMAGLFAAVLTILFFCHAGVALGVSAVCMVLLTVFHVWDI